MTEQEKIQSTIEENMNAAVDQVSKTAESVTTLGRKVTSLWLGVSRTAIDAAASTLKTTSEMISGIAESMGELSNRVEGSKKKA
jgi:DNA-binding ferritin-like protein